MANYLYEAEIIKKDAAGNFSVADLTVDTNLETVTSGSPGTEFILDGVSLGPVAPTLYTSNGANNGTVTLQNGDTASVAVMSFMVGTDEYFILQNASPGSAALPDSRHIDANRVADLTLPSKVEMNGAAHTWLQFRIVDSNADIYQGEAIRVIGTAGVVHKVYIADDDAVLEVSSFGTVETGNPPHSWTAGSTSVTLNPNSTTTTTANTVTVTYTTATGGGTFEALATTYFSQTFYIPVTGSVDLSTITAVTGTVETATPVTGLTYDAFGLTADKFVQNGDSGDNLLLGDLGHDKLNGKKGIDTVYGDRGDDLLKGGKGGDTLYGGVGDDKVLGEKGDDFLFGGMGDDDLQGGEGKDTLYGGAGNDILKGNNGADTLMGDRGDDTLKGENGNDTLKGGAGLDTLQGGDGKDTLIGHAGQDTLNGGNGSDTMTGGSGADTFILKSDGKTDTITDFEDGTDLIDIDVAFAALTITNGVAGEVLITHSGETLVVQDDGLGLLTAADFSAADFL
jgi:Ca2+-binding RTX toxin-like protein